MFGWLTAATERASRSKRARSASGRSSLTATVRSRSSSVARQPWETPPAPGCSSRGYRPPITSSATGLAYVGIVASLVSVRDAQRLVLEHAQPLSTEVVPLADAAGRVAAS